MVTFFYVLPFQLPSLIDGDQQLIHNPLPVKDDKAGQLHIMINKGWQMFEYKTKFDTAKELVEIAFNFAKTNHLKIPYQLIWLNAEVAFREGNIYKASVSMEKALPELEPAGNIKEIITARNFRWSEQQAMRWKELKLSGRRIRRRDSMSSSLRHSIIMRSRRLSSVQWIIS